MRVRTFDHSSRLAALAAALTVVPAAFGLAGCSSTANPPGGAPTLNNHHHRAYEHQRGRDDHDIGRQ